MSRLPIIYAQTFARLFYPDFPHMSIITIFSAEIVRHLLKILHIGCRTTQPRCIMNAGRNWNKPVIREVAAPAPALESTKP